MNAHERFCEAEEIKKSIKSFFSESKIDMDNYHIQLKKRIDELFEFDSHIHRHLHQFIAISRYCFNRGIRDINRGALEFAREDLPERLEFDVNYFNEYNSLNNEEVNRFINADESCRNLYGCSLGEFMKERLLY